MDHNVFTASSRCLALALVLAACDDGSTVEVGDAAARTSADLTVLLEAEDTVVEGIAAGEGDEAIQDGWAASFERYVVVIGAVDVQLSADEMVRAQVPGVFAVDLTEVPVSGLPLWSVARLPAGRYELRYQTPSAGEATLRHGSVTEADFAEMTRQGWTYLIEGELSRTGGQSCPPAALATPGGAISNGNTGPGGDPCYDNGSVRFRFGVAAGTRFGPCEIDEVPGFVVTASGMTTVALTIHGDHLFFNGFPESAEGGVTRLAQWLADCDLDLDGEVTAAELAAIELSDLAEIDARFQLGGAPITPLTSMLEYLAAQLKTQGHFQGEGECPHGATEG